MPSSWFIVLSVLLGAGDTPSGQPSMTSMAADGPRLCLRPASFADGPFHLVGASSWQGAAYFWDAESQAVRRIFAERHALALQTVPGGTFGSFAVTPERLYLVPNHAKDGALLVLTDPLRGFVDTGVRGDYLRAVPSDSGLWVTQGGWRALSADGSLGPPPTPLAYPPAPVTGTGMSITYRGGVVFYTTYGDSTSEYRLAYFDSQSGDNQRLAENCLYPTVWKEALWCLAVETPPRSSLGMGLVRCAPSASGERCQHVDVGPAGFGLARLWSVGGQLYGVARRADGTGSGIYALGYDGAAPAQLRLVLPLAGIGAQLLGTAGGDRWWILGYDDGERGGEPYVYDCAEHRLSLLELAAGPSWSFPSQAVEVGGTVLLSADADGRGAPGQLWELGTQSPNGACSGRLALGSGSGCRAATGDPPRLERWSYEPAPTPVAGLTPSSAAQPEPSPPQPWQVVDRGHGLLDTGARSASGVELLVTCKTWTSQVSARLAPHDALPPLGQARVEIIAESLEQRGKKVARFDASYVDDAQQRAIELPLGQIQGLIGRGPGLALSVVVPDPPNEAVRHELGEFGFVGAEDALNQLRQRCVPRARSRKRGRR